MVKPVTETEPVKRGRPSWKPFRKLDVANKDPNFRYRWVLRDAAQIEKKKNEGWDFVNEITGIQGAHSYPSLAADGKSLETTATYREHVLMALPMEMAEARDAYFNDLTTKRTGNLVNKLRTEVKDSAPHGVTAPVHGTITIT